MPLWCNHSQTKQKRSFEEWDWGDFDHPKAAKSAENYCKDAAVSCLACIEAQWPRRSLWGFFFLGEREEIGCICVWHFREMDGWCIAQCKRGPITQVEPLPSGFFFDRLPWEEQRKEEGGGRKRSWKRTLLFGLSAWKSHVCQCIIVLLWDLLKHCVVSDPGSHHLLTYMQAFKSRHPLR